VLLPSAIPYVGLLGPKSRGDDLLARAGFERGRLRNPIGLDLGADTPDEIALSIVAEVQAALAERGARPLSEADSAIHGRTDGLKPVLHEEPNVGRASARPTQKP
ncbi:MAG TPA: XdhC family protein, partial [Candidatus Elarobacter sp.]|nr:XdhC family protein [Candidatus Elarobacter sp.]